MQQKITKLVVVCDASVRFPDAHIPGRSGKGKAACGVVFLNGTKILDAKICEDGTYLGEMTVPEAEYRGLLFALDMACGISRNDLEVWLDSELVVRHLTGEYRLRASNLKPLFDEVKKLEARFQSVKYFHHGREHPLAQAADRIAGRVLEQAV